jgi:hypothetical protein
MGLHCNSNSTAKLKRRSCFIFYKRIFPYSILYLPISVAVRSICLDLKLQFISGVAGLNPAESVVIRLLCWSVFCS